MDALWIILIAVLLAIAAYIGWHCWAYEREKRAFLISDAREAAEDAALTAREQNPPFDIPVLRDNPKDT